MPYTPYRGLTAVKNWVKLKFAAMNLKKFAIHKDIDRKREETCYLIQIFFNYFFKSQKPEIQFA